MKILYAAGLSANDSSLYRLRARERPGQTVVPFNAFESEPLRAKVRAADDASLEGPAARLDDLAQAGQCESLSLFDVPEKR
jgi:hypothetical protein